MISIDFVQLVGELREFAQQANSGPLHLEQLNRAIRRSFHGSLAGPAGQHALRTELIAGFQYQLSLFSVRVFDEYIHLTLDDEIKIIVRPISLVNNRLSRVIGEQLHVRTNRFALVVPPVHSHFKV